MKVLNSNSVWGMHCGNVLESAAAELVDESGSLHPLEQLEILAAKADELKSKGETDAVIECRIKQLTLQKVLSHLHRFPLQSVIQAQAALAEAYGQGGYFAQVCNGGIYGDLQCRRLQADLLASEGSICVAEGQLEETTGRSALCRRESSDGRCPPWTRNPRRIGSLHSVGSPWESWDRENSGGEE
eukprot:Skav223104  [mRNA]  locus=scaffold419:644455:647044:+ [translate_table: standard]